MPVKGLLVFWFQGFLVGIRGGIIFPFIPADHPADDDRQVRAVRIDVVFPCNVLDALRNELENIDILVNRKLPDLQGARDIP